MNTKKPPNIVQGHENDITANQSADYLPSIFLSLAMASRVFSWVEKDVSLKYPFPFSPNPSPGVPTTFASLKS